MKLGGAIGGDSEVVAGSELACSVFVGLLHWGSLVFFFYGQHRQIFSCVQLLAFREKVQNIWGFPEIGVPPNHHPFRTIFPFTKTIQR